MAQRTYQRHAKAVSVALRMKREPSAWRMQLIIFGLALIAAGLALKSQAGAASMLAQMDKSPAAQSGSAKTSDQPAESEPGGTRPTTPAPEPARPDADAQKEGAPTALPPAPAEKEAAPINSK
jgi:hypothetical protein